jgi:DNA gyrase/topoisomerase IV subunit A
MNEQDLLLKIEGLEKVIQEKNADANRYQDELKTTKKQLVDYNKPELTPEQSDAIECAVEQAVNEFDFSDTDNYEIDYSLDYDGRVQCESHEFINDSDLVEMIVNRVCNLFKEAECPEELDTTEPDHHA